MEGAAAAAGADPVIRLSHVLEFVGSDGAIAPPEGLPTLAQARRRAERQVIVEALARVNGDRARAATLLRISLATLYRKLGACADRSREPQSA